MKDTNKKKGNIITNAKLSFFLIIVTLIVFLIGITATIKFKLEEKFIIMLLIPLLISFILFVLKNVFYKIKPIRIIITILSLLALVVYPALYVLSSYNTLINRIMGEKIDIEKYSEYYSKDEKLKETFPESIPKEAKDTEFRQAKDDNTNATVTGLYYVDSSASKTIFDKKYDGKTKWVGSVSSIPQYKENKDVAKQLLKNTPIKSNVEDFTIYLVNGDCKDPTNCNNKNYAFTGFNPKTKEVFYVNINW